MKMPAKNFSRTPVAFLLLGAMCVLMATTADARGGRGGGGGGFSRSSPASGGSFASRPALVPAVINNRQSGGDVGQPRTARDANGAGQPTGAQSAGGVSSAEGVGAIQTTRPAAANVVTPQQMADYRKQFAAQNKDADQGNWDNRWHENDNGDEVDDGGVERPVAAAAVVGAVARTAAVNRADDYADYVNTVGDPAYLTDDTCSVKAITAVNDVTYYRCSDAWYTRGYQSGSVVYIPSDPPAGY